MDILPFTSTLAKSITNKRRVEKRNRECNLEAAGIGWIKLDPTKQSLDIDERNIIHREPVLKIAKNTRLTGENVSLLRICKFFVNKTLFASIVENTNTESFKINSHYYLIPTAKHFYKAFAIQFRVMAHRRHKDQKPLRYRIEKIIQYYKEHERFKNDPPQGKDATLAIIQRFFIRYNCLDALNKNFESIIITLGQCVVGDEKLFRFTGRSAPLIYEPKKPDVIGLWFYELVCFLAPKLPIILNINMYNKNKIDEPIPIYHRVKEWNEVIERKSNNNGTFLVFDSLYMSNDTRDYLMNKNTPFIGASGKGKLRGLYEMAKPEVQAIGDYAVYYNQNTSESYVMHYENETLGRRTSLTNCFMLSNRRRTDACRVPIYDEYKACFSACDKFNSQLAKYYWPYSRGGSGRKGTDGQCHSFCIAAMLRNIFNIYFYVNQISKENRPKFKVLCQSLADELYEYAITDCAIG